MASIVIGHMCPVNPIYNPLVAARPRPKRKSHPAAAGRQAWLEAARRALIEEGTAGVEVNKLARRLQVPSRSNFYWFFEGKQDLLDALARYWADTSLKQFEREIQFPGRTGLEEYQAIVDMWIDESEFDPQWDSAVRDWARTLPKIRQIVERVDRRRIAILEQVFQHLGYKGLDAHVRARVMYYHQVGYYAMGVKESRRSRRALRRYYRRALTGRGA